MVGLYKWCTPSCWIRFGRRVGAKVWHVIATDGCGRYEFPTLAGISFSSCGAMTLNCHFAAVTGVFLYRTSEVSLHSGLYCTSDISTKLRDICSILALCHMKMYQGCLFFF